MLQRLGVLVALLVTVTSAPATTKATERPIKILNQSGSTVEIYWIHPSTRELSLMSNPNVMNGAPFNLNSFVEHEFEIRELPSAKTGLCKGADKVCRTNYLMVTVNSDQSTSNPSLSRFVSFAFLQVYSILSVNFIQAPY